MSGDFQITALVDELSTIEAQLEEARPTRRRALRDLFATALTLGLLIEVVVDWAWWVVVLLGSSLVGLGYLRHFVRIRSLTGRRDRLLAALEE